MYICIYTVYIYIHIYICIHTCIYIIYIHIYTYVYIHCICRVHVVLQFLHTHTHTHIHIHTHAHITGHIAVCTLTFMGVISHQGRPQPLENEINKILFSKREDRFSDHFPDLVQNICSVRFSYLLRFSIFCKAPRDMRKFPQKCQKIAGC